MPRMPSVQTASSVARCFDLQKLYNSIALTLGHGVGSTYGVKPAYGLKWGTHTIWWDNTICGGPPP